MEKCSKRKNLFKGSVLGIIIHSILCPIHGIIPILAIKIGIAEFIGLGFLYKFHDYITERIESFIFLIITNPSKSELISHILVDVVGIAIAIIIPVLFIRRSLRKQRFISK